MTAEDRRVPRLVDELGGKELHAVDVGRVQHEVGQGASRLLLSDRAERELRYQRLPQRTRLAHPVGHGGVAAVAALDPAPQGALGNGSEPVFEVAGLRRQVEGHRSVEQPRRPVEVCLGGDVEACPFGGRGHGSS